MDQQDRQAIEGLFHRLGSFEQQGSPRDAEAEAFIARQLASQPGAAYYMAQTVIMQEYAMQDAQRRIEALEQQAQQRPAGGFLASLFGGGASRPATPPPAPRAAAPGGRMPPGMQPGMQQQPGRGGGFLAGAAQTAMGVAGGVLLANAVGSMFAGDAQAADAPADDAPADDPGMDDGGFDFGSDEMEF
ncbi:DUF2076 domain-containing protein [Niveispirillum fermenti]|uniref:DUF2076 domain-containing protein n=1 Tax=Niveispirillum fermenti TaxID=1233113 RepID=UPI003A8431A3